MDHYFKVLPRFGVTLTRCVRVIHSMSGFCHFVLVYSWFSDRALILMYRIVSVCTCGLECAQTLHSLLHMLCFMCKAWCSVTSVWLFLVLWQLMCCLVFLWTCGFVCAQAMHSLIRPHALCYVWSVVFRSLLSSSVLVQCWGSNIHAPYFVFHCEHTSRVFVVGFVSLLMPLVAS